VSLRIVSTLTEHNSRLQSLGTRPELRSWEQLRRMRRRRQRRRILCTGKRYVDDFRRIHHIRYVLPTNDHDTACMHCLFLTRRTLRASLSTGLQVHARLHLPFPSPASLSTSAQPTAPRVHTTVAALRSCGSGMTHRMSCTSGHGHSDGLGAQTRVSGQR
jgi:hypothetical protein